MSFRYPSYLSEGAVSADTGLKFRLGLNNFRSVALVNAGGKELVYCCLIDV